MFPMTMRAGVGKAIAAPAKVRRVDAMAVACAAIVLIIAASPGEGFGAQRSKAALPDHFTVHDSRTEPNQSGDERSPGAASAGWGHGLQLAALSLDSGKLGEDAGRAVNRWPAAQKADPAWDWVRVLVFLVQSALIVQGHDPGKPDGLMGPKTMLALLAWSAASGPSWDGNDERSYRWGLDGNVAHLLHGTLEALRLAPGPKDRFLGRESAKALERWDGTFRRAGMFMRFSKDVGKHVVLESFDQSPSSDMEEPPVSENAADNNTEWETSRQRKSANHCVKIVRCPNRHGVLGNCIRNRCGNPIRVAFCIPESKWSQMRCNSEYLSVPGSEIAYYPTSRYIKSGEETIITHEGGVTLRFMACFF